ncbi:MAG: MFS transporter, partial [Pandoraea sp.]|nr:MFS transporter [Pandoraea sp.]
LFALVFLMRSHFNTLVDTRTLMIPTFLQGVPMSMFFIPLTAIILSGLPPSRIPAAAGLSNFVRITCGAVGTSIATTMWENRITLHHAQLTEHLTPYNPTYNASVQTLNQLGMSTPQANGYIDRLVTQQSAMLGANDIFWISALLFVLMISMVWITRPMKGGGGADAAAGAH